MKMLCFLPVLFLCACGGEAGTANSAKLPQKFQDVCATYSEPEFEMRLAELIPTGEQAGRIQDLLAIADHQRSDQGFTTYVFRYATDAFADQGLVVSVTVNDKSGRIEAVESAVAAN